MFLVLLLLPHIGVILVTHLVVVFIVVVVVVVVVFVYLRIIYI